MIVMILAVSGFTPNIAKADSSEKTRKIEQFVEQQKKISKIPGISLVIVEKGKTVYQKGFGYADVKAKTPVTSNTLFEIGSTTKAWEGDNVTNNNHSDSYQKLDSIVTILCIVVGYSGLFFILLTLKVMRKLVRKQRIRTSLNLKRIILLCIHTLIVAAILILILIGLPWTFIKVWAPTSITVLLYSVITTSIIYYLFGLLLIFTKSDSK